MTDHDDLRAAVERLADEFESEVDWSSGRNNYGDNEAWESAARQLRALLAEHPSPEPPSGSEVTVERNVAARVAEARADERARLARSIAVRAAMEQRKPFTPYLSGVFSGLLDAARIAREGGQR